MKHLDITVRGKVQGVGFRFSAMEAAYRFGINGFVKYSGSDLVYIEAEGRQEMLDQFVSWCRRGPLGARVTEVETHEAALKNFTTFEILRRSDKI